MKAPRVLFATSEVAPLIKTGGLADVSAALPGALAAAGCDVRILLPGYGDVLAQLQQPRVLYRDELAGHPIELLEARRPDLPTLWLVRCPRLFDRPGNPYVNANGNDWEDNAERYAVFARAAAQLGQDGLDIGYPTGK